VRAPLDAIVQTYTMEGPDNPTEHSRGMIPRAVQQIFECAAMVRGSDRNITAPIDCFEY